MKGLEMFEGIQERLTTVGESIADWVAMDHERGARMERILTHMSDEITAFNASQDRAERGTIRSVIVGSDPSDGASTTQVLAKPKQGVTWIVEGIFVAVANAAAARKVSLYVASGTTETGRPLTAIQVDNTAEGETLSTQMNLPPASMPLPESMGVLARGLALAAGEIITLHLIVRELAPVRPKRMEHIAKDEAHGGHEGRPTENKINFGRPEVPQRQGTDAKPEDGGIEPAVQPLPAGLNGAPPASSGKFN